MVLNPVYQFLHRHRQPPLAKDIDALMPWVHAQRISVSQVAETPRRAHGDLTTAERLGGNAAYDPSDNEMVISPIADGP